MFSSGAMHRLALIRHLSREGHTGFDSLPQKGDPTVSVGVVAPEVGAGKSHRAKANATNLEVAADSYCSSCQGRQTVKWR
jgi:hypothetical protein